MFVDEAWVIVMKVTAKPPRNAKFAKLVVRSPEGWFTPAD